MARYLRGTEFYKLDSHQPVIATTTAYLAIYHWSSKWTLYLGKTI